MWAGSILCSFGWECSLRTLRTYSKTAEIITQRQTKFHFRNVMVHPDSARTKSPFSRRHTNNSWMGGSNVLALKNKTARLGVQVKTQLVISNAVLTTFTLPSVSVKNSPEAAELPVEHLTKVQLELELETIFDFSSFAQNIVSTTNESEKVRLRMRYAKGQSDHQLLKEIPGADHSSVCLIPFYSGVEVLEKLLQTFRLNTKRSFWRAKQRSNAAKGKNSHWIRAEGCTPPHREKQGECTLVRRQKPIRKYKRSWLFLWYNLPTRRGLVGESL